MKINQIIQEQGIIVPGVNTTVDVKPGETERQAAKFGSKLGKDGPPLLKADGITPTLYNPGLAEAINKDTLY